MEWKNIVKGYKLKTSSKRLHMSLQVYNKKRHFNRSPEPSGRNKSVKKKSKLQFVVQRHDASHLHFDFRLELNGILKSWAIPKGPSMNPNDKRLAIMVEDHPLSYGKFEGTIPKGNYGAGTVEIWDKGTYEPEGISDSQREITKQLKRGSLKFFIAGDKLKGSFALVRLKDGKEKNWLLIKHKDEYAVSGKYNPDEAPSIKEDETDDGILRQPVFMGLRVDKSAHEVDHVDKAVEQPRKIVTKKKSRSRATASGPENKKVTINKHTLQLTNLNKIYWPDDNITKGDLIAYYNSIHKFILPHLKDRPQSLKRNPNGIKDAGFYHKDAGDEAPSWVKSIAIHSESSNKDVDYIICNDKATLTYLNNLGCIEINPWNSTTKHLDKPDYMIMDIDPSEKNTFEEVIEVARAVKEVLDRAGAKSYCKTSGASGLHVYIPLHAAYTYEQVRPFAELIAIFTNQLLPDTTTMERSLNKRNGRIYLDHLQNKRGQTLAAVYSVRPVPGASVSTPLNWKEVKQGLHPLDFTIFNIKARIEKKGELFRNVLKEKTNLNKCIKALEGK